MLTLNIYKCMRSLYSPVNFRSFHHCGGYIETLPQITECRLSNYLQVRWKKIPARKPRWMPMAKTKLFVISPKPNVSDLEKNTEAALWKNYYSDLKSIQQFCAAENEKLEGEAKPVKDIQEFEQLLQLNQEENQKVAKIREQVKESELALEAQALIQKNEVHEQWLAAKKEEVEALVKYEKLQSLTFIRLENLESAIEHAIDNPVNYNFAIDLDGKVQWEKEPHPVASPHWVDDKPRERLGRPPYRPIRGKRERKSDDIKYPEGFWI